MCESFFNLHYCFNIFESYFLLLSFLITLQFRCLPKLKSLTLVRKPAEIKVNLKYLKKKKKKLLLHGKRGTARFC